MSLYKGKYRIESARLRGWDYGSTGYYFVTICTYKRRHYFGWVKNGEMVLSDVGKQAMQCILDIPRHFPHTGVNSYIVMPNHVHLIIDINNNYQNNVNNTINDRVETQNFASHKNHETKLSTDYSKTQGFASLHNNNAWMVNSFGSQSKNLASIIRGFKIGVTVYTRNHSINFAWQPRFHDRIIWNAESLYRAQMYIKNNPKKWYRDRNNLPGLYM